jgi:hypothetical protein
LKRTVLPISRWLFTGRLAVAETMTVDKSTRARVVIHRFETASRVHLWCSGLSLGGDETLRWASGWLAAEALESLCSFKGWTKRISCETFSTVGRWMVLSDLGRLVIWSKVSTQYLLRFVAEL